MKLILNIIICALLIIIWSDIETNIETNSTNYSNSILSALMILIFSPFRYYATEFQNYLLTRK